MAIIFYEKEHVESILNGSRKNKTLRFFDLSRMASYFRYEIGKSREQAKIDIIEFCKENNPNFNYVYAIRTIKNALKWSDKCKLRTSEDVIVTKSEMAAILESFDDYKYQKVLFWMLVVAKHFHKKDHYLKHRPSERDEIYYYNFGLAQAFRLAKVHVSKKKRFEMLYDLQQSGMIEATLSASFKILFVDEKSDPEIVVDDLDDIISFFPYYCEKCGKKYEIQPYSQNRLCDDCYEKKRKNDLRLAKRRERSKK